jgi:transcription initiation factor TFIIIB Brf1 subunit/transcription initiation factor TFIIB
MDLFDQICQSDEDRTDFLDNEDTASVSSDLSVKLEFEESEADNSMCPYCFVPGRVRDTKIYCTQCGLEREWDEYNEDLYDRSIEQNHNTSSNSFVSFNIVGKNCSDMRRSYMNSCANYSSHRRYNSRRETEMRIYQYDGREVSQTVIDAALEIYEQIKDSFHVFRGNGKWGIIAACLYYAFIKEGQARTPKEVASILGTDEKFLSQGDRKLLKYNDMGIISIPTSVHPIAEYLHHYMTALEIDLKYKVFILDIINRAQEKYLHIKNDCRTTTKCVGAIYLLCQRVPELRHINKQQIADVCKISKSTFLRYYELIMRHHELLEKSFRRNGIPMPVAWRK